MSIIRNNIGFVIRLIGVLIIASLATTSAAAPSLSNSGGGSWQYQKDITISNTGGALSDYQVLVSLTSGDFPTNAQTSGADVRFTDVSGAELSYWIESWYYSSRTAKIWVKVPSISAGTTTTIRMYYGNPSATSMSSGEGAFVFFDDFSGGSLSSKWISSVSPEGRGTVTVSNGMLNLIANPTPGPSGTWSVGEFAQVKSTASFPLPYKLVFRYSTNLPYSWVYPPTGASGNAECYHLGGMSDYPATAIQPATDNGGVSNGILHLYSQNAGNPRLLTISTSTTTRTNFDLLPNVFKTFEYRADSSSVKFISDGTVIVSHSTNIPITPLPIMFEASQSRSGYSRCGYYDVTIPSEYHVDYVFLAKYASPEPTLTLGGEQPVSAPVTTGTITVNTNLAGAIFSLTGASSYSGSGTSWSTTSVPAGTYTITYGAVTGYNTPPSETKTLSGGSITFSGTYSILTDTVKPIVSISSPYNGQSFTTNTITVSGTAFDDVGLSKIEVKVGTGSWQLASGTTSWSKQVTLSSGSNTIYARATDTSGNTNEVSVSAVYVTTLTTSATISLSGISSLYNAGDTLSATVYVTNTGGSSHIFPVGFSVRDPNGNWNDIPYRTVTLNPGSSSYVYFTYNIPPSGPAGTWTARTAVYDYDAGGGNLQIRYDYKEQTFSVIVSTPTPTPTQQLGTIIVTTNKPEATFTITGTATYSGSGTYWSQSNVPVGTYTITYTSLSGHIGLRPISRQSVKLMYLKLTPSQN